MPDQVYDRFRSVLTELLQLDDAPLESPIHRIMGLRRSQLDDFLNGQEGLVSIVRDALAGAELEAASARQRELRLFIEQEAHPRFVAMLDDIAAHRDELRTQVEKLAPPTTRQDLLRILEESDDDEVTDLEAQVYNSAATFFELYYANGDFGYRNRSAPVFNLPYDGRDLLLHWKFRDSYYIKSTRMRPRLEFTPSLDPESRIAFELTFDAAEAGPIEGDAKFFQLVDVSLDRNVCTAAFRLASAPTPKVDVYSAVAKSALGVQRKTVLPYLVADDDKPFFNDPKRDSGAVREGTVKGVRDLAVSKEKYHDQLRRGAHFKPLGRNPQARLAALEKDKTATFFHELDASFNRFLVGIDADYFVQIDLGRFLRGEKDRFIKEVIFGDVTGLLNPGAGSSAVAVARAFDAIADAVISVLEAAENFERDLFLLRKKVTRSDYLISIGLLPPTSHRLVFANKDQLEHWKTTLACPINRVADLGSNSNLPVNTRFFDRDETAKLVGAIEDIDAACSGVAIHGDSFQVLNLIEPLLRERVRVTYIDPPYNTGSDGFLYKDNFRHASWLSMMDQVLAVGHRLTADDGTVTISVDDVELANLAELLTLRFGAQHEVARLVWDRNRKNDAKLFSVGHEYMLVVAKDAQRLKELGTRWREDKPGAREAVDFFNYLIAQPKPNWTTVKQAWTTYLKNLEDQDIKRWLGRYRAVGPDALNRKIVPERGPYRTDRDVSWPGAGGPRYVVKHPRTKKAVPIPDRGWEFADEGAFWAAWEDGRVRFGKDHTTKPSRVTYLSESLQQVMSSVQSSYAQTATQDLLRLFGRPVFTNPKNWRDILRLCSYMSRDGDTILDYFAGSGTTGHAVLELNRRSSEAVRRFVVVESGDHFDTVLVPRLERVMYSSAWKDGQPSDHGRSGSLTMIKLQEVETFEDVVGRLEPIADSVGLLSSPLAFRGEAQRIRGGRDSAETGPLGALNLFDPDANIVTTSGGQRTLDLFETYCYLRGLNVRSLRVHTVDRRAYRVARTTDDQLLVFRNARPGADDSAAIKGLLDEYAPIGHLHVNADVDRRKLPRGIDVTAVTAADFDVGAAWS